MTRQWRNALSRQDSIEKMDSMRLEAFKKHERKNSKKHFFIKKHPLFGKHK
jgi:hypothetical protein